MRILTLKSYHGREIRRRLLCCRPTESYRKNTTPSGGIDLSDLSNIKTTSETIIPYFVFVPQFDPKTENLFVMGIDATSPQVMSYGWANPKTVNLALH